MDFCPFCGKNISEMPEQSSASGTFTSEDLQDYAVPGVQFAPTKENLKTVLRNLSKLIDIWVVASALILVICLIRAETLKEICASQGITFPEEIIANMLLFCFLSCVTAAVASILCYKAVRFKIAVVSCIASSVLSIFAMGGFFGFLTFMMGLNISMSIIKLKGGFDS